MYTYWRDHQHDRDGRGPRAADMAAACDTTLNAAREALRRYRRGRVPQQYAAGLSPKSVKNIHVLLHKAFSDAVAWGYLRFNPAEHAVVPRARRRDQAPVRRVWTIEELGRWLDVALDERFAGMWLLAATTGMRRSELAGVRRDMLDLDTGILRVEDTRVVVAGRSHHSDGKTAAGRRGISLDTFTREELTRLLKQLDEERTALGAAYPDHGLLMVNEEGRPLHPDTITARFNRLVERRRPAHPAARRAPHLRHPRDGPRHRPQDAQRPHRPRQHLGHAADLHPPLGRTRSSHGPDPWRDDPSRHQPTDPPR